MTGLYDSFQRPINYLRISVTDRCNLRCFYCMPEEGVMSMPHSDILSYEELFTIVKAASEMGFDKLRLTGGEPLVRLGLPGFIKMVRELGTIDDISMTTNGVLLARYAEELKEAGLNRVNISLDTLQPEKFKKITRMDKFYNVIEGIKAAHDAGLEPVKINVVAMNGVNDDEVVDFARKTIDEGWNVRFIELMPVNDKDSQMSILSAHDMKRKIDVLGKMEPYKHTVGNGPAKYYRLPGAPGTIGFITAMSDHFCSQCNRIRLTADGKLRPCLFSDFELDVRTPLRNGASSDEVKTVIRQAIDSKPGSHHLMEGCTANERPFSQVGG